MRAAIAFAVAFSAAITCRAQEPYSHYLDSTCIWYGLQGGADGFNTYYTRLTFYMDGDTLVNGVPYFKQYYTRWDSTVHVMFPSPPTITTSGPQFYRALREDSLDRFWEWHAWESADALINDFRLNMGDLFPSGCAVDSISTLFFNGSPLKRFWPAVSYLGGSAIEGVGDAGPVCGLGIESNAWLGCFSKQGLTLQVDTSADCSVWPPPVYHHQFVLVTPENAQHPPIRTYPNPSADRLNLEWPSGSVDELVLLDPQGVVVDQRKVSGSGGTQLSLGRFGAGMYLLQFKKAGRIIERRPVIKE